MLQAGGYQSEGNQADDISFYIHVINIVPIAILVLRILSAVDISLR